MSDKINKIGNNHEHNKIYSIRWVVALKAEARAICQRYKMSVVFKKRLFPLYKNSDGTHWLVISGVGRVNVSAATIYLHQQSNAPLWAGWINIGIAGHKFSNYGKLFLIDKITDNSNGGRQYPRFLTSLSTSRGDLITVDKAETDYFLGELFDMEGAAFFEVACRLVCQQMVLVLKIVSDGPNRDINELTTNKVINLIDYNINEISALIKEVENFSCQEHKRLRVPQCFDLITQKWHFSESRKVMLKKVLIQLSTICSTEHLIEELGDAANAASVLNHIRRKLDLFLIDWQVDD